MLHAVSACSHNTESSAEKIRVLLKSRADAAKKADKAALSSLLTDNSAVYGKNKFEFLSSIKPISSTSVTTEIFYETPKITLSGDKGEILQPYRVRFKKNGDNIELEGEERITVVSENGTWKINGISAVK